MKKVSFILVLMLVISLLAGCAGTAVVYYNDCTCDSDKNVVLAEGELKTGLAILGNARKSVSAEGETAGEANFDITVAAVLVDQNGVIIDCIIDSVGATVKFDNSGVIDPATITDVATKNELGEAYGMKLYGGSTYEWDEQAAALCEYAIGKTVEELKTGAINESGMAADADLASKASIYLGGYVSAIEAAVNNAASVGAQAGDELRLAVLNSLSSSKSAEAEKSGTAQLDCDVAVITLNDGKITGCVIDSLQAKVPFDDAGVVGEIGEMLTKNQLGEAYGMKMYAGSAYEWNEQVAAFCAYVTGLTPQQVADIAVNERTAPTDADLSSTVTIAIAGLKALIAKAAQ